jgi:hypothetical protein
MTPDTQAVRGWVGTAFAAAQLAAVASHLLPWPAAVVTLAMTWFVTRRETVAGAGYTKAARAVALVLVSAVALHVVLGTSAAASSGDLDPLSALRSLSWVLIALCLITAPSWSTVRDYRGWIGLSTAVLVASAAPPSPRPHASTVMLVVAWGVLLVAVVMLQRAVLVARGTVVAVTSRVDGPPGRSITPVPAAVLASIVAGAVVFLSLPGAAGGAGLPLHLAHDFTSSSDSSTVSRSVAGVDTTGTGDLDLLVRGALPTTPLLDVPADSPPLWRGSIYSTYTGQSWQADFSSDLHGLSFARGADVAVPPTVDDPPAVGTVHRYEVHPRQVQSLSLVWAPGVPLRVAGIGLAGVVRVTSGVRLLSPRTSRTPSPCPSPPPRSRGSRRRRPPPPRTACGRPCPPNCRSGLRPWPVR